MKLLRFLLSFLTLGSLAVSLVPVSQAKISSSPVSIVSNLPTVAAPTQSCVRNTMSVMDFSKCLMQKRLWQMQQAKLNQPKGSASSSSVSGTSRTGAELPNCRRIPIGDGGPNDPHRKCVDKLNAALQQMHNGKMNPY